MRSMKALIYLEDGEIAVFHCPGCGSDHRVKYSIGTAPAWYWNGDRYMPTFHPSIKANLEGGGLCHSEVAGGQIRFLKDSSHALAGQTVDLPNWEKD